MSVTNLFQVKIDRLAVKRDDAKEAGLYQIALDYTNEILRLIDIEKRMRTGTYDD